MNRNGFTMIELIFVIVILGILAAVALPKFIGVGNQAHDVKVVDFTSSLNRTVMPQIWSKAINDGYKGDITKEVSTLADLQKYTQIPSELTDANLSRAGTGKAVIWGEIPSGRTFKTDSGKEVNAVTYAITCTKGSTTSAPDCKAYITDYTTAQLGSYTLADKPNDVKTLTK